MKHTITIGTRQSQLARWQTEFVASQLRAFHTEIEIVLKFIVTQGDRVVDKPLPEIGGKGVFTAELEAVLLKGEIDLAVHSLKDLPTDLDSAFTIGAIPERASPFDVLISRSGQSLSDLPVAATVGTSSLRRVAQLRAARSDLNIISLRGNVPTRLDKVQAADGLYDAIVLAEAGLQRLDKTDVITEVLPPEVMLPAPAQGALAVQCRADDERIQSFLAPLDHQATRLVVEAERAFLNALDSGCRLPVAALAHFEGDVLHLTGRVISLDGTKLIMVRGQADADREHGRALGRQLAAQALAQGAGDLLDAIRKEMPE